MRKLLSILGLVGLVGASVPLLAHATVTPSNVASLVTSATSIKASSAPLGLFSLNLSQSASETLSSVSVTIANQGSSNADSSDFTKLEVYKDNGNGIFEPGVDTVAGTQTSVLVGSATTINTTTNNAIDGGKFFVALSTSANWSDVAPGNSITVALGASAIATSANSPTVSAVTTAIISADTTAPGLVSALAQNTGGTNATEAGDSIVLTFSQATNKPSITAGMLPSVLQLNNGHSFLDGAASAQSMVWNAAGTTLTITLSSNTSVPTVAAGDIVTVAGTTITDLAGNVASGNTSISGTFATGDTTGPVLSSVVAQNTGGTSAKEAGDSILFTFNEATNKPVITSGNIASVFALNNGHTFVDGSLVLGSTTWNAAGTMLTVTLSGATSVPTVAVGDIVTVQGAVITDAANNNATGNATITGTFGDVVVSITPCTNGIVNGTLYKARGQGNKVFQGVNCTLVPFTGSMSTYVHGHKKAKKFFMLSKGQFKKAHHEDKHESHGRDGDR